MDIKIKDFLKEYIPQIPESLADGEIFRLTYSEKLDHMTFFAHFQQLVPADDIFAFEKSVAEAVKTDYVRLICRYPEDIFGMDCYGELVRLLKRDISVLTTFLV